MACRAAKSAALPKNAGRSIGNGNGNDENSSYPDIPSEAFLDDELVCLSPSSASTKKRKAAADDGVESSTKGIPILSFRTLGSRHRSSFINWDSKFLQIGAIAHLKKVVYGMGDAWKDQDDRARAADASLESIKRVVKNQAPAFSSPSTQNGANIDVHTVLAEDGFQYDARFAKNLKIDPEMTAFITKIGELLARNGYRVSKSASLHAFLLWFTIYSNPDKLQEKGVQNVQSERLKQCIEVPNIELIVFILMFEHWLRWHEENKCSSYFHPSRWMQWRLEQRPIPNIPEVDVSLAKITQMMGLMQTRLQGLPLEATFRMLPQYMPGSKMAEYATSSKDGIYSAPTAEELRFLGFDHISTYSVPSYDVEPGTMTVAIPARLSLLYFNPEVVEILRDGQKLGMSLLDNHHEDAENPSPISNGSDQWHFFGPACVAVSHGIHQMDYPVQQIAEHPRVSAGDWGSVNFHTLHNAMNTIYESTQTNLDIFSDLNRLQLRYGRDSEHSFRWKAASGFVTEDGTILRALSVEDRAKYKLEASPLPHLSKRISEAQLQEVIDALEQRPQNSHIQWEFVLQHLSGAIDDELPQICSVLQRLDDAAAAQYKDTRRLTDLVQHCRREDRAPETFDSHGLLRWVPQTVARLVGADVGDLEVCDFDDPNIMQVDMETKLSKHSIPTKLGVHQIINELRYSTQYRGTANSNEVLVQVIIRIEEVMKRLDIDMADDCEFIRPI